MEAAARIEQLELQNAYLVGLVLSHREVMRDWFYLMAQRRNDNARIAALFQRTGLELVKPMREAGK